MAFTPGKTNYSYKHIEAKTAAELEKMMLEIAIKSPYPVTFTPPTYSSSKWFSWYMFDWSESLREV